MELLFLALLIFIMAVALGSGYPVAFALPGAAIITVLLAAASGYLLASDVSAYFHTGGPYEWISAGVLNLRGVYWEVERDTLIAIPLFIFMGIMLQKSKIAEELLITMAKLFGPVPGGLGISVVFVGALLAATTGIVGATVVAMGLISLPAMLRNNYSPSLATGTIAASGTLGQIIPPSIVLIILADQLASAADQAGAMRKALHKQVTGEISMPSVFDVTSTSAGEMFLGALVPGILLVLIYMAYILGYSLLFPKNAPAVENDEGFNKAFYMKVAITLVPPLALIILVLGSIIAGIATVNQAGAIGAVGATVMAGYKTIPENSGRYTPAIIVVASLIILGVAISNFDMNIKAASTAEDFLGIYIGLFGTAGLLVGIGWSFVRVLKVDNILNDVMLETSKTTALVFIILLGAAMLTSAFRAFGGEEIVKEFLSSLPGGFWAQFAIVMLVIFILGFFLDFIEIAVVVVPIVAPILLADPSANITAVWLGVMIGLNIQTSFLTPPFGFALFYLRGVAPAVVKTIQMYRGVVAFITLQLIALVIVGLYPPLVNYLPNRSSLLSEAAPPPRNPRLQFCLDQFVTDAIAADQGATMAAINAAKTINVDSMPKFISKSIEGSTESAEESLAALAGIQIAADAVKDAEAGYRPQLTLVRGLEKQIRNIAEHRDKLAKQASRMNAGNPERAEIEAEVAHMSDEIAELESQIPDSWEASHDTFKKLTDAESKARNSYRRSGDTAWEDAAIILAALDATPAFIALESDLNALRTVLETADFEVAEDAAKALERSFRDLEGADDVKKAIGKAKSAMSKRKKDRETALKEYEKALAAYADQLVWRAAAETQVRPGVEAYLNAIKGNIGARAQEDLTREQALFLASCTSHHKDLSLNF